MVPLSLVRGRARGARWSSSIACPSSAASPRSGGKGRSRWPNREVAAAPRARPGPLGDEAAGDGGAPVREEPDRRPSTVVYPFERLEDPKFRDRGQRRLRRADRRRARLGQLPGRPRAQHRDVHLLQSLRIQLPGPLHRDGHGARRRPEASEEVPPDRLRQVQLLRVLLRRLPGGLPDDDDPLRALRDEALGHGLRAPEALRGLPSASSR